MAVLRVEVLYEEEIGLYSRHDGNEDGFRWPPIWRIMRRILVLFSCEHAVGVLTV